VVTLDAAGFPILAQARTYSFGAQVLDLSGQNVTIQGGIRKFMNELAGLGPSGANNIGQYISVAVPDTTTYPGSDYYEIAAVQYDEQMHSDLPPTRLRGYVQLETAVVTGSHYDLGNGHFAVDPPHYLGATIVAEKDRPVRVKFYNLLPTGDAGNLFIPVDTTVMGSGMTADGHMMDPMMMDPLNPMCSAAMKAMEVAAGNCYPDNRATLHLHGGISPWISDGTPRQWITPAGEDTPYPQGVSVVPVPDMGDSGDPTDGVMTFYYTNQQSARLMFYHDHAWGITRLNVYAGEASGYLLRDATEQSLVDLGLIPADEIPLIIQDKTFVPDMTQLMQQDETWDVARWGGEGSLWVPHVYSPAQNPGDSSGVNQYGRWAYGPWFWPPTTNVEHGPIANPYFDPACDPDLGWCEPPLMPGVPFLSMGMESFNDTPVVNGTVYPTLAVEPKAYRFRVLNAANDRFFNLSLYQAVDANGVLCDANNPNPAVESTGVAQYAWSVDRNGMTLQLSADNATDLGNIRTQLAFDPSEPDEWAVTSDYMIDGDLKVQQTMQFRKLGPDRRHRRPMRTSRPGRPATTRAAVESPSAPGLLNGS
jgi:FtsP/CotA-like multicopper oxidase with cupredoxin domain